MHEKDSTVFELYYFDIQPIDTSSLGDADEDSERQEEIIYSALDKYFSEHPINLTVNSPTVRSLNNASSNDALEFASSTDSKLYTVDVVGSAPTSSAQQTTLYLLDTRNILLIFALTWLCVTLYSKIKNLIINYTTKN